MSLVPSWLEKPILAIALTLIVAGCASEAAPPLPGVYMVSGANHKTSSEHWEVSISERDGLTSAAVMSSDQGNLLQLVCYQSDKSLTLMMVPEHKLDSPVGARRLLIGFDGAPPTEVSWTARDLKGGYSEFEVESSYVSFPATIRTFKAHGTVRAVFREGGKATRTYDFSLTAADKAIDYVLAACGKQVGG